MTYSGGTFLITNLADITQPKTTQDRPIRNLKIPSKYVFLLYRSREGANKRAIFSQAGSPIKFSRVWTDFFSHKHLESSYLDRFFAISGVIPGF